MDAPERNVFQRTGYLVRLYLFYQKLYFRTLVEYRADTFLCLLVALACGMLIFFSAAMLPAILSFWIVEVRNIIYPIAWFADFARHPLGLFPPAVRFILTGVVPYAAGSFYPAAFLLRPEQFAWAGWTVPACTLGMLALMYSFRSFGLRRYSSSV